MPIEINGREYEVVCESAQERIRVIDILLDYGYKWHSDGRFTGDVTESEYPWGTYPIVVVNTRDKTTHGRKYSEENRPQMTGSWFLTQISYLTSDGIQTDFLWSPYLA